jgi:hypothetical protein
MNATPVLLLLCTTVSIGAFMAWRYYTGVRNSQGLAAVHFLFGAGGLEVMALVLGGAPNGAAGGSDSLGPASALVLAAALLTGLFIPIIARPKPGIIGASVAVHATVATLAFGIFLLWFLG